jgi:phosphate transport system substrate-binding protein
MRNGLMVVWALVFLAGCNREPGSRVFTKGSLTVAVDEAIAPVMTLVIDEFQRQYPDAKLTIRSMPARDAVVAFASDSVRVIVCGRELNTEEKNALAGAKVGYQDNRVAMSAIAVIGHKSNPRSELRVGEVDSMFAGTITRWKGRSVIDLCIGGPNSSTNEVFRTLVLQGKPFSLSATPYASSSDLVEHVRRTPAALGIVNLSWLKGVTQEVRVMYLGRPGVSADSTEPPGKFYSPAQAYVYKGYYPVNAPIFIYSREMVEDLAIGFVSFVASPPGQKVFLNNGLVPQTQPIRLVQVTSNQVN